jgi:hypothetical protein
MFSKLADLFRVYRAGMSLATVVKGKQIQIAGGYIAALLTALVALAKTFGVDLPLTDVQIMQLSGAVVTIWGVCSHGITVATSTKVGLLGQAAQPIPVDVQLQPGLPSVPTEPSPPVSYIRRDRDGNILKDGES